MLIVPHKRDDHDVGLATLERVDGAAKRSALRRRSKTGKMREFGGSRRLDLTVQHRDLPGIGREDRECRRLLGAYMWPQQRQCVDNSRNFRGITRWWPLIAPSLPHLFLKIGHVDNNDRRRR